MRLKACKRCGQPFETDRQGVYMCPACSAQIKRDIVFRERVCSDCGVTFMGFPKSKRCPECQADVNRAREAEYKRKGPNRHIGDIDICERCGKEYIINSGRQRYCKDCAPEASRENVCAIKREYAKENKPRLKSRKDEMRQSNKLCVVCGKVFDANTPTVTCSPECAKARKNYLTQESLYKSGKRKTPPGVKYNSGLKKSGVPGVTMHRGTGKWQAKVKNHYIGLYPSVEDAVAAIENYKKENSDDKG